MSEQGVPISEVTAGDFIQIRAALVKRLGGGNEAIVWACIEFRCRDASTLKYVHEGERWWRAKYDAIGAETGLSAKQVRTAIESLVRGEFLVREQHSLRNNYDQTYSYRPVVIGGQIDVPGWADEAAQEGNSGLPEWADVPIPQELKKVTTRTVAAESEGQRFAQPLCDVLSAELTRLGVKHQVGKRWLDASRLLVDADGRDPHEAKTLIEWALHDPFWTPNIESMPTFRKQYDRLRLKRGMPTSGVVARGRDADAILRARAGQQKAVAS